MDKKRLAETVEKARNGDKKAFETLYGEYHDKLYFFVLKNVKNKETAEDITHETFLRSMEKISELEKPDTYGSWLHSIAYNKCRDHFRKESQNAYFNSDEELESAIEDVHINEPIMLPDDYAVNKDLKRQLKKVIDELKPDMKSAVILYYYNNMSVEEVARTLKIKENAAKQKLFQARKKLKKKIDKLTESGASLCAVPVGAMLRRTISPKYAETAVKSGGSAVSSYAMTAKVVGITAAAVIAVGVPISLALLKNNDPGHFGNQREENSSGISSSCPDSETSIISIDDTSETDIQTSHISDDSAESTDSVSQKDNSQSVMIGDNSDNSANGGGTGNNTGDSPASTDIKSLTGEKLLSMSLSDVLSLGDNDYEMIYPTGVQNGNRSMYQCAKFPEYCFRSRVWDNEQQDYVYAPEQKINFVNLYEGAKISDDITVGMTYNELKEIFGKETEIFRTNTDLEYASAINVNGRLWIVGYDLTDEQKNMIWERIKEQYKAEYENGLSMWELGVDISDINPVSRVAVCDMDRGSGPSLTGEKLLSMTVDKALEFCGNDYDFVYEQAVQEVKPKLYKCSDFPEYCFRPKGYDAEHINVVNLYKGAYINNNIYVGMNYNQLSQMSSDISGFKRLQGGVGAEITVNGIKWDIYFDYTDEQYKEMEKRASADGKSFPADAEIDVSDMGMELVSRLAVYSNPDVSENYDDPATPLGYY
ncbi:MAG: sigma-70 family RNA polymerase sigma factor [Ruminococcus sp.]|nr:sigma-70 family RNA polymerase sigma factor [Ruminococcus sp.]